MTIELTTKCTLKIEIIKDLNLSLLQNLSGNCSLSINIINYTFKVVNSYFNNIKYIKYITYYIYVIINYAIGTSIMKHGPPYKKL